MCSAKVALNNILYFLKFWKFGDNSSNISKFLQSKKKYNISWTIFITILPKPLHNSQSYSVISWKTMAFPVWFPSIFKSLMCCKISLTENLIAFSKKKKRYKSLNSWDLDFENQRKSDHIFDKFQSLEQFIFNFRVISKTLYS